jgi:hypothetical protein
LGGVGVAAGSLTLNFTAFGAYMIDAPGTWIVTGANTLAAGQSLTDAGSLTIGGTIANAGTLIAAASGTVRVESALTNSGTLVAEGTLIVEGAVTGTGVGQIDGGTLDLMAGFNQAVTFTGATGVLELAQSQSFRQGIRGFSTTGGTALDLGDIAFVSAGEATFSGAASFGVLTVTDGLHTTRIRLHGHYLDATFVASSDGKGGTFITASDAPSLLPPSARAFIGAMAGLGGLAGAALHGGPTPHVFSSSLVSPHRG